MSERESVFPDVRQKVEDYCSIIERWRTWPQTGAGEGHRLEEDRLLALTLRREEVFALRDHLRG